MPLDQSLPPEVVPHRVIRPPTLYFGTPVALLTTINPDGEPNISPLSSAWALGDRVVLGLSDGSQGLQNAMRDGDCVINIPSAAFWPQVERLARATGRVPVPAAKAAIGYYHEPRKFAASGLTPLAADLVRPPRIAECPLQFEARVVAAHAPGGAPWQGGDERGFAIVETQVLRVHAHETVTVAGTDHVDVAQWRPLLYVFRHYVAAGDDLGRTFKAEK